MSKKYVENPPEALHQPVIVLVQPDKEIRHVESVSYALAVEQMLVFVPAHQRVGVLTPEALLIDQILPSALVVTMDTD